MIGEFEPGTQLSASPLLLIWVPKEPQHGVVLGQQFRLYSEGKGGEDIKIPDFFAKKSP